MPVHHGFNRLPGRRHIRRIHRPFGMNRRITSRQHQPVGGAGGHGKLLGQFREHLAAGDDRPLSTKLRWRADMSASIARSSWLNLRRARHSFSTWPTCSR